MHELRLAAAPTAILLAVMVAGQFAAPLLSAETLAEALATARRSNPRLLASLAHAHSVEAGVEKALAGYRPSVTAHASAGYATDVRNPLLTDTNASWNADVMVAQPLFDGGRTTSAVRAAEANASAEHANVSAQRDQVSMTGITAFADVLLYRRIVDRNKRALDLFERTAADTRLRAAAQEATRADVAQAEAAVAGGTAQVAAASATLAASEAVFEETLLHAPGRLDEPPPISHLLPASRERAVAQALQSSPLIAAAEARRAAAMHGVDAARAVRWPSITLQAGYRRGVPGALGLDQADGLVASVVATVPLYAGGAIEADIAAAGYEFSARTLEIEALKASIRTSVVQAWARMTAARTALAAIERQRAAARTALRGLEEELRVGQRTVAELIAAQQAVINAEIAFEQTRRDLTLAEYAVLTLAARLSDALRRPEAHPAAATGLDGGVTQAAWRTTTIGASGRDMAAASARR